MNNAIAITSLVALFALVAIGFVNRKQSKTKWDWTPLILAVVSAMCAVAAYHIPALHQTKGLVTCLFIGAAISMLFFDGSMEDSPILHGISMGAIGVALCAWSATAVVPKFAFGVLAGIAAGLMVLSAIGRGGGKHNLAVLAFLAFGCNVLGKQQTGFKVETAQILLAIGVISIVVGEGARLILKNSKFQWPPLGTALIFSLAVTLLSGKVLGDKDFVVTVGAAALIALICAFAIKEGAKSERMMMLIGAVIWVSLATVAYGPHKAYGMAVAAIVGAATLLILGQKRLMPVMAPLFAFVGFQVLNKTADLNSDNFVIGQHYTMIGLLVGLTLPLLLLEIRSFLPSSNWARTVSTAVAGIGALVLCGFLSMFLGDRGAAGLVIGLTLSGFLALFASVNSSAIQSVAFGLLAWTSGFISCMSDADPPTRQEKVWLVVVMASVGLICAAIVAILGRQNKVVAA